LITSEHTLTPSV